MTLIEIMVVVAILGLLMSSVGVYAFEQFNRAKINNTKLVIKQVAEALHLFQVNNPETCPKTLLDLHQQKYLTKEPVDSWGQPLDFTCPGQHNTDGADIVSRGADRQQGTADDIKSWLL